MDPATVGFHVRSRILLIAIGAVLLDSAPRIAASAETADPGRPMLVFDTGGHTDSITRALFRNRGRELVSVSKDKTIRVWSAESGEMLRVLRPPIGPAREGVLYAAALSPDGTMLAVGGVGVGGTESPITIVSLETGTIAAVLREHTDTVVDLAFSPDGQWLASAAEGGKCCLWDWRAGRLQHVFVGHRNLRQLVFAPDGRHCVTAGHRDKTARIWSVATGQCEQVLQGHDFHVLTVGWSADGRWIATGGSDGTIRIWAADGSFVRLFHSLGDGILSLTFTADSRELLFTRGFVRSGDCSVIGLETGAERLRFTQHSTPGVWHAATSPDGRLAATAGHLGHELFVWRLDDGAIVHRLGGKGRSHFAAGWSRDGSAIAWGDQGRIRRMPSDPVFPPLQHSFRLTDLEWGGAPDEAFQRARTTWDDLALQKTNWDPGSWVDVLRGGLPVATLRLRNAVDCYTLLPGGRAALGNWQGLYLFDAQSARLLHVAQGHSGDIAAIAPSLDGRYLLTASIDQTLRIWDPDRAQPLVSLFFADRDWIAWTPEGYYACSPGGERLMGWQVNQGLDKMGVFYPAAQFRKSLYRPDVVRRLLEAGSLAKAMERADAERGKPSKPVEVAEVLPPAVSIVSTKATDEQGTTIELSFVATSGTAPITASRLFVNGRPYPGSEFQKVYQPPRTGEIRETWLVRLEAGAQQLAVQAETEVSRALSEPVQLPVTRGDRRLTTAAARPAEPALPSLYILAIGISDYPGNLKLDYAARDASALAEVYRQRSKALYRQVEIKLMTDQQATRRNILQGLTWLRKQMTQNDVAVLSFAGHGAKDADGTFYLLPVDVDTSDLLSTGVPGDQIKRTLAGIPGRFIVLLDACHAGAVDGERRRAAAALTDDLVRDLATDDYGVVVMCSSMGREFSLESAEVQHGYFTLALVEGLTGRADYNQDQVVHLNEIDLYVTDRVKQLSEGKQHPVTARPTSIRSFPLSQR